MLEAVFGDRLVVDATDSGEAAVERLRATRYDAILADYQLGWMNGIDLLQLAARETPDAVRILFTGHASLALAREAIDRARIHAFITKPVRAEALREAIRHVVGVKAPA